LYAGVETSAVQELLQLNSAVARAGSVMADRFAGFDLSNSKRLEWPGGQKLLRLRHQIVLNRLSTPELKEYVQKVYALQHALSLKPLLAEVLTNRGFTDPSKAISYLHPSISGELERLPHFMPLYNAATSLYEATSRDKRIVLVADFDADGNCSAALLRRAIEIVGGRCELVQPDRVREGYGLTAKVLPRVLHLEPELLVTLDLGTSDGPQFDTLISRGIQTVCVDHHKPQAGNLAKPDFMVNPHLDWRWEGYQDLCASGLAWMLSSVLFERHFGVRSKAAKEYADALLPFASTGTVADVMQLKGLNRAIVARGNEVMLHSDVPAFRALTDFLRGEQISGEYIGFHVGPMLNACGRINVGTPEQPGTFPVSEFLNCRELDRARELSAQLIRVNRERQKLERGIVDGVARDALNAQVRDGVPVHCGTVLPLESAHEGIVGLVAARTMDVMQCPMIVLTRDADGNWKGSGRSIPGVDLMAILESLKKQGLIVRGGGHPAAIGVVVAPEQLERFTEAFRRASQERLGAVPPVDPANAPEPVRWIKEYRPDLIMSVDELSALAVDVRRVAKAIEPCGRGNDPIKILLPNVRISSYAESDAGHLRVRIEDGANPGRTWVHQESLEAVVFARSVASKLLKAADPSQPLDLIVQPAFDRSRQVHGREDGLSVQVLLAQPSVFNREVPEGLQRSAGKKTPRVARKGSTPTGRLFDPSVDSAVPPLSSAQDFYDYFGITLMTEAVEFRKEQFEFVASQILRERLVPGENLLYRAEVAAGKTVLALLRSAELLSRDPKAKVLYLTPQHDLVAQALADIKVFLNLQPEEVAEFTGRTALSIEKREALLRGAARIVVGTPQTFKPFIPDPHADIAASLAAPLTQFGLVILDEVHLMHGDLLRDEPSRYAYRAIAAEVIRLQKHGVPIRLWAQSGTPADTIGKRHDLAQTLQARYEKLVIPSEAKRWETTQVALDPETRRHVERLRDAYKGTYRELLNALPMWVSDPRLLQKETPLHRAVIEATKTFKDTCHTDDAKTLPARSEFLASQKVILEALGKLTENCRKNKIQTPGLSSALSRVGEMGAILRYFDALRSKGRRAFAREAARKMLQAIWPAKESRPAALTNCHVRLCRRPEMKQALDWAMTEPTAKKLLSEFRRLYRSDYGGYKQSERTSYTRVTPRSWREILSYHDAQLPAAATPSGTKRARQRTPSRLDVLDERLLQEFGSSERSDLKELALLEILRAVPPGEKSMIMIEQKFEARVLAERLTSAGIKAGWYAGRSVAKRLGMRENLDAFRSGDLTVLCSTSSGDTGHNIPMVSRVIRWVPLSSPKKNIQSAGRAGRQKGVEGIYIVLLVADNDPDIDERGMHQIALARSRAMRKV
jgi:single-stranded-DNA-specific exonuclease